MFRGYGQLDRGGHDQGSVPVGDHQSTVLLGDVTAEAPLLVTSLARALFAALHDEAPFSSHHLTGDEHLLAPLTVGADNHNTREHGLLHGGPGRSQCSVSSRDSALRTVRGVNREDRQMNTTTQTELNAYMDEEGVVRASASYNEDHAFNGVWQDGLNDHIHIVLSALGGDFSEPSDTQEVNRIAGQLRHLAEIALEEARETTNDAEALALFRRSAEIQEAASALNISHDTEYFYSQMYGDEQVEYVREIVQTWDALNDGFVWSESGERTSALDAWDREMYRSRSGYSEVSVEATEDWINISFSGYGCDMGDLSLVVRRGEVVEAVTSYVTDIDLAALDGLEALGDSAVFAVSLTDLAPLDLDCSELAEVARLLSVVKTRQDMDRVRHTVRVLSEYWMADFVSLVRASIPLTL